MRVISLIITTQSPLKKQSQQLKSKMQGTVVLYPSPGMGHVISMVELGKLIHHHYNHRFSITILLINSELWYNPSTTSYINSISQSYPSFSFIHFPRVSVDTTPTRSRPAMAFESILLNKPNVLDSLQEISKTKNISAFVIDMFCGSALSIGKELKIPTYYFFTSGAACLAAFFYFPRYQEQYTKSFKDLTNTVLDFPGLSPLRAVHIPEPMLDRNDPAYDDMVYFCSKLSKADGIIVNTFDDLETKAIKAIADGVCVLDAPTPNTFYIGPLIKNFLAEPESGGSKREAGGSHRTWESQHDCLSWLDKQPRRSVIFLCFGSRGSFTREQVKEIGNGLERSGQRFLWVVKNIPEDEKTKQNEDVGDFDLESVLPEGFLNRVKEQGMVVKSWAPQIEVLNHESVGGFVTHCGWNSVLEAVVAGVPMVAWPLYAEQHLNRTVLVEDMQMAIQVEQRDGDGFVTGDELEKRVRELMESEKGNELRERSRVMRQRNLDAWTESGSSIRELGKLVELWK